MNLSGQRKLKILYLKQFLEKYSDTEHHVTVKDMRNYLLQNDINAERKSLYEDIMALQDFGMDIGHEAGSKYYTLFSRDFEISDLKLMIDSIQSSKSLSVQKSSELIKKLEKLCSTHQAKELNRQVIVSGRAKTDNEKVFYNIDAIHKAILEDRQIRFLYFTYDARKNRRYNRNKSNYFVSPFALIYSDDNYYLLAFDEKANQFRHYRVDRMESVDATEESRAGKELYREIDLTAYTKYTFGMFGGQIEEVAMVFSNHLMSAVIDRFGHDVTVFRYDEKHFKITVPVAVSDQFFGWVFGLGKGVRIISPPAVVEKMRESLAKVNSLYETENL